MSGQLIGPVFYMYLSWHVSLNISSFEKNLSLFVQFEEQ